MCECLGHARVLLPEKLTVSVLSDLAIFRSVDNEWLVASGCELLRVRVVDLEGDGLATKPIAYKIVSACYTVGFQRTCRCNQHRHT
jgi:hypothetical protein